MTRTRISPPKYGYFPLSKDRTVEIEMAPAEDGRDARTYSVYLDGDFVGFVFKSTRTWERKTAGKRYVNNRGQTPCWRIRGGGYRSSHDTRSAAVFTLAENVVEGMRRADDHT